MNLYLGDQKPRGLKGTNNYFLLATFLLTAWGFLIYFVRRFKINIYGKDQTLSIEINDRELDAPIVLNYPFTISKQYIRRKNGHAYIKELFLTFFDKNNVPVLTLKGSLGDVRQVPSRFEYIDISNQAQFQQLKISKSQYATKVKDIEDALQIHLNYIYSKILQLLIIYPVKRDSYNRCIACFSISKNLIEFCNFIFEITTKHYC
ncbi:MAG: hypothetical protein V4506_07840 [Bacteroidota bacterium]